VQIDVEVVEPEVGHDFLKLGAGIDVASEPLGSQLVDHNALGVLERVNKLSLRWAQVGDECCTLRRLEGLAEAVEFRLLHGAQTANALLGREERMRTIFSWRIAPGRELAGAAILFIGRHRRRAMFRGPLPPWRPPPAPRLLELGLKAGLGLDHGLGHVLRGH